MKNAEKFLTKIANKEIVNSIALRANYLRSQNGVAKVAHESKQEIKLAISLLKRINKVEDVTELIAYKAELFDTYGLNVLFIELATEYILLKDAIETENKGCLIAFVGRTYSKMSQKDLVEKLNSTKQWLEENS